MSFAETAEIPLRIAPPELEGLGIATAFHCVPFHCSASGRLVLTSFPTAQTSVVEMAATALRFCDELRFALTIFHFFPFQCWTCDPTAHTSFDETPATP